MSVTCHVDANLSRHLEYKVPLPCDGKAKLSTLALGGAGICRKQLADNLIFTSEHTCKDEDKGSTFHLT